MRSRVIRRCTVVSGLAVLSLLIFWAVPLTAAAVCGNPVKILGDAAAYYTTVQGAYNAAVAGDKILITRDQTYPGDVILNSVNVILSGGWDCNHTVQGTLLSEIRGDLTIASGGAATVDRISIGPSEIMPPPNAPTNLHGTDWQPTELSMGWNDNSADETGFEIQQASTCGSTFSTIGNTAANQNSFTVTGLAPSTSYCFRVRAVNGYGYSGFSNAQALITNPPGLMCPTGDPLTLGAQALSSNAIAVTWTDVQHEDGYSVYYWRADANHQCFPIAQGTQVYKYGDPSLGLQNTIPPDTTSATLMPPNVVFTPQAEYCFLAEAFRVNGTSAADYCYHYDTSQAGIATLPPPTTGTLQVVNNSSLIIYSLWIDGVQRLSGQNVNPGQYWYDSAMTAGNHTVRADLGLNNTVYFHWNLHTVNVTLGNTTQHIISLTVPELMAGTWQGTDVSTYPLWTDHQITITSGGNFTRYYRPNQTWIQVDTGTITNQTWLPGSSIVSFYLNGTNYCSSMLPWQTMLCRGITTSGFAQELSRQ